METIDCIKTRRSVRIFTDEPVDHKLTDLLIAAAVYAPSGKNGQPWRFAVIRDSNHIHEISSMSGNKNRWIQKAPCLIAVYLDRALSYDYVKDIQSTGAAIQNILLAAYSTGLGTCWVGGILDDSEKIKKIMGISSESLELMALVAIGHSSTRPLQRENRDIKEFVINHG